jgi:predicted nucleic acid-binding protein
VAACAEHDVLTINPIIYAEVSIGFTRIEDLDVALAAPSLQRLPLPWEAAFLAGKCYVAYRKRGGSRSAPLPDFYIGAHASVAGLSLLTRDATRYRTYFPKLRLIAP